MYKIEKKQTQQMIITGVAFTIIILFAVICEFITIWLPRYPDPFGYLANAAYFTSFKFNWSSVVACIQRLYAGGYSLILVPLMCIAKDYQTLSILTWGINLIFISILFYFLNKICDYILCDISYIYKTVLVLVICISPQCFYNLYTVTPEIACMAIFSAITYLVCKIEREDSNRIYIIIGAILSCIMLLFHSRFIVIFLAYNLFIIISINKKKIDIISAIMAVVICIGGFILYKYYTNFLKINVFSIINSIGGNTIEAQSSKIRYLLSREGLWSFVSNIITQLFYIIVITYGMCIFLIMSLLKNIKYFFCRKSIEADKVFVSLCFIGLLVISSFFLIKPSRIDHIVYGRYIESVVPVGIFFALSEATKNKNEIVKKGFQFSICLCIFAPYLIVNRISDLSLDKIIVRTALGISLFYDLISENINAFIVVGKLAALLIGFTMFLFCYQKKYSKKILLVLVLICQIFSTKSVMEREIDENRNIRMPYLQLQEIFDYQDVDIYVIDGQGGYNYLVQLMAFEKNVKVITLDEVDAIIQGNEAYFIYDQYKKYKGNNSKKINNIGVKGYIWVGGNDYINYLQELGY